MFQVAGASAWSWLLDGPSPTLAGLPRSDSRPAFADAVQVASCCTPASVRAWSFRPASRLADNATSLQRAASTTACSIGPSLRASDLESLATSTHSLTQSPAICAARFHSTSAIAAQEAITHLVASRAAVSKHHLELLVRTAWQQLQQSRRTQRRRQVVAMRPTRFAWVPRGYQAVPSQVRRLGARQPTTRGVCFCAHDRPCRSP